MIHCTCPPGVHGVLHGDMTAWRPVAWCVAKWCMVHGSHAAVLCKPTHGLPVMCEVGHLSEKFMWSDLRYVDESCMSHAWRMVLTLMSLAFRSSFHTMFLSLICQPKSQGVEPEDEASAFDICVLDNLPNTCSMVAFCFLPSSELYS